MNEKNFKPKFDMLELEIPIEAVYNYDENKFNLQYQDGKLISLTYQQKVPFFYRVSLNLPQQRAYLSFSGKTLLENYPEKITYENFNTCIENINKKNVCKLSAEMIRQEGVVLKCDVTEDIIYEAPASEIYTNLSLTNNYKYTLTDFRRTQFAIISNNVTPRCKSRLVVYNKNKEMERQSEFLSEVKNAKSQTNYFKDKLRLELNLSSKDRIRKWCDIEGETTLKKILKIDSDPISNFLESTIREGSSVEKIKLHSSNMKDVEHLLVLAFHNWELTEVEKTLREVSCRGTNIKQKMVPYQILHDKIFHKPLDDVDRTFHKMLSDYLKYMVNQTLKSSEGNSNNLLAIYRNHKN